MSTFGPPIVIDGPLPVAPLRSLLKVPGVVVSTSDDRWMNGVALWGYPEDVPSTWDPCGTGTYEFKSDDSNIPTPDFGAFVVYQPVTCSAFSIASDPDGFAEKAEIALDAMQSFAIERALAQGVPAPGLNPFLADANVSLPAGAGAVSPIAALAYLEEAIGATGRMGMIHATPGAASAWFSQYRDYRSEQETPELLTSLGTPVAAGGGYAGATPAGGAAPTAGQSWAYATGPVEVRLQREITLTIKEVLDRSENLVTFRAERYALVEWDTSLQAAVLVDWSP